MKKKSILYFKRSTDSVVSVDKHSTLSCGFTFSYGSVLVYF